LIDACEWNTLSNRGMVEDNTPPEHSRSQLVLGIAAWILFGLFLLASIAGLVLVGVSYEFCSDDSFCGDNPWWWEATRWVAWIATAASGVTTLLATLRRPDRVGVRLAMTVALCAIPLLALAVDFGPDPGPPTSPE
jgi:hypothetical protein